MNKKIKLCMIMPFELSDDRGDKMRELRNAKTFLKSNKIELYIISPDSKIKKNLFRIKTFGLKRGIIRQFLILFFGFLKTCNFTLRRKPDVFFVRGEAPLAIAWFMKKIFKIPFVIDLFSVDESIVIGWFEKKEKIDIKYVDINQGKRKEDLKTKRARILNKINNFFALNNASLFTMEMDYQKEILKDMGIEDRKLHKLLPSVSIPKNKKDKYLFDAIFIGSLDDAHLRMIEPFIEKMNIIISKYPNFKLVLVGGGYFETDLKKKVKKMGFEKNTVFKGRVPNVNVMNILRVSKIALSYSTGQKCYEYCALGKPVLAFDGENTRNVLGKAALYADTWEKYIDNLIILLDSPEKYEELSRNAKKLADSRSIDKISRAFYNKLEEVLKDDIKTKQKKS